MQTVTRAPIITLAYTELSNAIPRALTLTREAGDALTTAGQALGGLSGVLAAVAAMSEVLALAAWDADPAT